MKLKLYSVRDAKVEAFQQPFFARTTPEALRVFTDSVNDPNPRNSWRLHPEDFALFELGEFSEFSGKLEALPQPTHLATAFEVLKKPKNPLEEQMKNSFVEQINNQSTHQ